MIKGATTKLLHVAYDDAGLVADLSGATIKVVFKKNTTDLDGNAVLTKTIGGGVTITDAANGLFETVIAAADTNDLAPCKLFFEAVVKLASGGFIRGKGELEVEQNVLKVLF